MPMIALSQTADGDPCAHQHDTGRGRHNSGSDGRDGFVKGQDALVGQDGKAWTPSAAEFHAVLAPTFHSVAFLQATGNWVRSSTAN
jgi:hypothetical protein